AVGRGLRGRGGRGGGGGLGGGWGLRGGTGPGPALGRGGPGSIPDEYRGPPARRRPADQAGLHHALLGRYLDRGQGGGGWLRPLRAGFGVDRDDRGTDLDRRTLRMEDLGDPSGPL